MIGFSGIECSVIKKSHLVELAEQFKELNLVDEKNE